MRSELCAARELTGWPLPVLLPYSCEFGSMGPPGLAVFLTTVLAFFVLLNLVIYIISFRRFVCYNLQPIGVVLGIPRLKVPEKLCCLLGKK